MNRKLLIAIGAVALIALGVAATDANAQCPNAKQFNLAFGATADAVLVFPSDANRAVGGGVLKGRFWQSGARTTHNEGTDCPESSYMVSDADGASTIFGFLNGDWGQGQCGGTGCPTGTMIMLIQTLSNDGSKAYYAVGKTAETDGFDFGRGGGNWPVVEMPRPKVTVSSRAVPNVNLDLSFDSPALGSRGESDAFPAESILSGYQIVRFVGTTDPGRNPAQWQVVEVVPATSTGAIRTSFVVDCTNTAADVFVATRPIFDGGQFAADYVSASTRVECDPNLADPRFKNIDKRKGKGPKAPEAQ